MDPLPQVGPLCLESQEPWLGILVDARLRQPRAVSLAPCVHGVGRMCVSTVKRVGRLVGVCP